MTRCAPPSAAVPGVSITAEDSKYRAGIIEGFVPVDVARRAGEDTQASRAMHAVHRPTYQRGLGDDSRGIVQHRVDQLRRNLDGTGITIGIISDSYNTARNFVATGATLDHPRGAGHRELRPARYRQPLRQHAARGRAQGLRHVPEHRGDGRGTRHGAADSRHGAQGAPRLCDRESTAKSSLPNTSARWPVSRASPNCAARLRGADHRRRRPVLRRRHVRRHRRSRRPSTTSRRWACQLFLLGRKHARRRKATPRIFASCPSARRDCRDEHQPGGRPHQPVRRRLPQLPQRWRPGHRADRQPGYGPAVAADDAMGRPVRRHARDAGPRHPASTRVSQRRSPDGRPHVHRRRGQAATRSTCRGSPTVSTRADRSM